MLLYATGSIGTGAFYAFNNFVLPSVLKAFGAPDLMIGLLSSTRSIEGAVIQPTVGALSDRIWTRFGRRGPFMIVGIPLSAVFFVAGSFVNGLLPLAIVIFLFSIFFNVAVDPYTALLADIAPLHQRGYERVAANEHDGERMLSRQAHQPLKRAVVRCAVEAGLPRDQAILMDRIADVEDEAAR